MKKRARLNWKSKAGEQLELFTFEDERADYRDNRPANDNCPFSDGVRFIGHNLHEEDKAG